MADIKLISHTPKKVLLRGQKGQGEEPKPTELHMELENVDTSKYCHVFATAEGHRWSGCLTWTDQGQGNLVCTVAFRYQGKASDKDKDEEVDDELTVTIVADGEEHEIDIKEYEII